MNLQSPGWTVRQGQAVWTAKPGEEGVAGELLLASRTDGSCFVQFAKPPFTLATARIEGGAWSLETDAGQRRRQGRGPAPTQILWFTLVAALKPPDPVGEASRGSPISFPPEAGDRCDAGPTGWRFQSSRGDGNWRLTNPSTGETLEGYLSP